MSNLVDRIIMNKELQVNDSWKWNELTFTIRYRDKYLYRTSWVILAEGKDEDVDVFTTIRMNQYRITREQVQEYYTKWHKPSIRIYIYSNFNNKINHMSNEIFDAVKAREMSENSPMIEKQLIYCCNRIKIAATQGKEYVTILTKDIPDFNNNSSKLTKKLIDLKYKVEHESSQREGSYLTIKW